MKSPEENTNWYKSMKNKAKKAVSMKDKAEEAFIAFIIQMDCLRPVTGLKIDSKEDAGVRCMRSDGKLFQNEKKNREGLYGNDHE